LPLNKQHQLHKLKKTVTVQPGGQSLNSYKK